MTLRRSRRLMSQVSSCLRFRIKSFEKAVYLWIPGFPITSSHLPHEIQAQNLDSTRSGNLQVITFRDPLFDVAIRLALDAKTLLHQCKVRWNPSVCGCRDVLHTIYAQRPGLSDAPPMASK